MSLQNSDNVLTLCRLGHKAVSASHFYEFHGFLLDTEQHLLFRDDEVIPLTPKAFETLLVLVENRGRIVDKETLLRTIWPDTFDEEGSLTRNISVLRKVLENDDGTPSCIETIPKRGYRFVASVRTIPIEHGTQQAWQQEDIGSDSRSDADGLSKSLSVTSTLSPRLLAISLMLVIIALTAAGVAWKFDVFANSRATPRIQSLAVLPLQNLSNDPDQAYFADGMTDALITELAKIKSLRVTSRTSVMAYKNAQMPVPEIARELGVDAVVEGTVTRVGNEVRITAQLIAARNDRHLWAEMYQRDLGDALLLQGQVAQAIVENIRIELSPDERARLSGSRRVDPEAYESYLRGRYYWNRRDAEGLKKAIEYFHDSTERDPNFALGYAGLADCYNVITDSVAISSREALSKAKQASLRALELDPDSAEAHASLGWVRFQLDWNWREAEKEFLRAIELNRSYATSHHWYAIYLSAMGRADEAIAEAKRAEELDPLSLIIRLDTGAVYYWTGHLDMAIQQEQQVLEMDPGFVRGYFYLAISYVHKGRLEEALALFRKGVNLAGDGTQPFQELEAWFYAASGRPRDAMRTLTELQTSRRAHLESYYISLAYAALGDSTEALQWLDRSFREHSFWMVYLNVDPRLDSLRGDPRFPDLLARVGLPQR